MNPELITLFVRDQLMILKHKIIFKNSDLVNEDSLRFVIDKVLQYRYGVL